MTELQITEEVKQLGVSKVIVTGGKNSNIFVYNGKAFAQAAFLKTELQKTLNELKGNMVYCGSFGDNKAVEKIILLLSEIWVQSEENKSGDKKQKKQSAYEKQRATEIETINAEINRVKNAYIGITFDAWKVGLEERYNELKNVVYANIPEVWLGLEFELSSLRILNIHDCDLPFIGIILARPSSYKTIGINLLRKWYCTFYTDSFSPKSWITHTTAVETEEELSKIDMLPKIKDHHFLTPELAPLFTIKDDDLGLVLGTITRIADGHGYGSDSGAHGHREYGDTMFVWTGAAVDIPWKVYKQLSGLGFKLYFFRLPYKEKTEDELLKQMKEKFSKKKSNIETALYEYLIWFEIGPTLIHNEQNGLRKIEWNDEQDSEQAQRWIIKLATLLKHLRCIAKTWAIEDDSQGSNYGYSVTQPESPERAIEVLKNLARGHALLTGRNHITIEDIPIVVKTVLSTANIDKVGLLRLLIANNGKATTEAIKRSLNVTGPTARRNMTELKAIGLVHLVEEIVNATDKIPPHKKHMIELKKEFTWLLGEDFAKLLEGFEPVDNREFINDKSEDGEEPKKGNSIPYTTFWRIFDELADMKVPGQMETDKGTVSGTELQERLIATNDFKEIIPLQVTQELSESGEIEKCAYDTYRRKIKENG